MRRSLLGAITGLAMLLPVQPALANTETVVNGSEVVRSQAIVRLVSDAENPKELLGARGLDVLESFGEESDNTFLVGLDPFVSTARQIAQLAAMPEVLYAEPNLVMSLGATSDDPSYVDGSTWGLQGASTTPANAYGSNAAGAWSAGYTGSSSVYVAVIDAGIDYNHPDLAANIWTNTAEANGTAGVDDDGNGFVDDIHGYDFVNDDPSVFDGDENRHGTHVAGTIAAVGGNNLGVAGVTWNTKLISVKVMDAAGEGSLATIIRGIDYVTMLRTQMGIDIIASNNSYGSQGTSLAMQDAVRRGGDAGIVFVAAAGNDGLNNDATPSFPANLDCTTKDRPWDCVVSVGALDSSGNLAGFSNYGAESVDILAPGVGILSTTLGSTYEELSGTSMAAPHVTGAIALCVGSYRGMSAQGAIDKLYSTGATTASASGVTSSGKRVDAGALAAGCASETTAFSGAQSEVYASAIYTDRIRLDWADTVAGDYEQEIQYSVGPAGCTGTFQHLAYIGPGLTSYPVQDLDEAEFYCFRIRSNNASTNSSYVKSNVSITWTSNLPFIGGKVQLPDGTTVANAPVKWLADGVTPGLNNKNAITTYTNESGEYVLQVSNGTSGRLFVDVPRYANTKRKTEPQLPWGLSTGGKLTVTADVTKDITVPQSHLVTFQVTDENSSPVASASLQNATLSTGCTGNGYVPFEGATDIRCDFWPTGYSHSSPVADASGEVTIALVDAGQVSGGQYKILTVYPNDYGRVESTTLAPVADQTLSVTMDPKVTLSGHVYMDDGTTPVSNAIVRWNAQGLLVNGDYTYAKSVTTDGSGAYSIDVSADTAAHLFLSTPKRVSGSTPTTPLLPWGLTASSIVTLSGNQTIDITAPPIVTHNLTIQEYDSTVAVSGAKIVAKDLSVGCQSGSYEMFDGASSSSCSFLPTGYSSSSPRTNSSGQVTLALLESSVLSSSAQTLVLSVTDPTYSGKIKTFSLSTSAGGSQTVNMPGPVTISGTVYLADGTTPVANAPVKWLGEGQNGGIGNVNATTVYTNSQGQYSISASMGTPGELFVETSRYARSSNLTNPQLPWGMHAGGYLTVTEDSVVDLVMPYFHYATFNIVEYASNEAVDEAKLTYSGLASGCKAGSYTAFIGATGSSCAYWPAGYSHSGPVAGADGVIKVGLLDTRYYNSAPTHTFAVTHPMDAARVTTKSVTVNNADQTVSVEMPGTPSKPEQPSATAETGKVVLRWSEPWSDGGSFIDYYEVWMSLSAEGPFELVPAGTCHGQLHPDLRTCEVEGLTPGVTYYFAIIAHNVYGYGARSLSVSSSPLAQIQDLTLTPTPTITGTTSFGQTLTAVPGSWDAGVTLGYQWRRDGAPILSATSSTYQLTLSDLGSEISVVVTGVKNGYNSVSKTSAATSAVTASQFASAPAPTISGTTTQGQALTAAAGSWDAGTSLAYQWLRSGVEISGATSSSYTLTASDVGAKLTVKVTGTKSGYQTQAKTSAETALVAAPAPVVPVLSSQTLTPTPTIAGDAVVDGVLTATVGTWDAGTSLSYRWLRNGTAIPSATATSRTLSAADLGALITFEVTSSKDGYETVTEISLAVGPVTEVDQVEEVLEVAMVSSPVPTISGSATIGTTLSATVGTWDEGAILSYQWHRDGVPIFGAVGTSYTLTQGDLGSEISFAVIGTKTGISSITRESATTAAVAAPSQAGGGGGGGGGGFVAAPPLAIPAISKPLPAGTRFALVGSDGTAREVAARVAESGKQVTLDAAGLKLDLKASSGLSVDDTGSATIESGSKLEFAASGYEPQSTVYFYLVPTAQLQAAWLHSFLRIASLETIELGSATVADDGSFDFSAKPNAASGDYLLQISGTNQDGEEATLAIAAKVTGAVQPTGALAVWTKKLDDGTVKMYAKNVVGNGKIQFVVNGREIAWVRAVDETDPKLRSANGFQYLVRTVELMSGQKNALEIYLDGERLRRTAYSVK